MVLALASALAVAACGGADGGGAADDRAKLERAALEHAKCLREHGLDVPDPKPGGGGLVRVGPGDGDGGEGQRRAMEACEKHLRDVPPPKLSDEQKSEMRDAALEHAKCMREHGIDFPDPKFGADGGITVKVGPGGVDPDHPKLRAAEKECARLLPQPGPGAPLEESGGP